jgi:hypothetical protein
MRENNRFEFPQGFIANEQTIKLIPQKDVCQALLQVHGQMQMELTQKQAESEQMTNFTVAGGLIGSALGVLSGAVFSIMEPENSKTWYLATSVTGLEVGTALGFGVDLKIRKLRRQSYQRYAFQRTADFSNLVWSKLGQDGQAQVMLAVQKNLNASQ